MAKVGHRNFLDVSSAFRQFCGLERCQVLAPIGLAFDLVANASSGGNVPWQTPVQYVAVINRKIERRMRSSFAGDSRDDERKAWILSYLAAVLVGILQRPIDHLMILNEHR